MILLVVLLVVRSAHGHGAIDELRNTVELLTKQLSMQQLAVEERVRSEGDSGIKQVRQSLKGDRPYYSETHNGRTVCNIHNHAEYKRLIGIGEFSAVLNGVDFRTRHNDYELYMPVNVKKPKNCVKPIEFPPVPPSVLKKRTVEQQTMEMLKYFRAWKTQNVKLRDYRPYFKPVLCYLEGYWTTETEHLVEPSNSSRHSLDATTWDHMHSRIQYTAYTGTKSILENFSFCPTKIVKLVDNPKPVFAQWTYRILCHPLKKDLPFNKFQMVSPDMANLQAFNRKGCAADLINEPSTRFQLKNNQRNSGFQNYQLIDELMAEIPGLDNYDASLIDSAMGNTAYTFNGLKRGKKLLNAARYNRLFSNNKYDAAGLLFKNRGFADENLFMAMNTRESVLQMNVTMCNDSVGCTEFSQRWSYAIPLEIIYLTPLSRWNPFHLKYKGDFRSPLGKTVTSNGRNGGLTRATAYDGVNSRFYGITPTFFFNQAEETMVAADTTGGEMGVLARNGWVRRVRASGHRIVMRGIRGVGDVRQRWPIMPLHVNGNAMMKAIQAMRDHFHAEW